MISTNAPVEEDSRRSAVDQPQEAVAQSSLLDDQELGKDVGQKVVRGGGVAIVAQGAKFVLRLAATSILARILTPADFGLVAMVTVLTGFVEMFKDAGLAMATVQRERITQAQVSTLFWINVGLATLVMVVIIASAPVLAWFYSEPRLLGITFALGVTAVFGGLAIQHQALMRRNLQFVRLAIVEIGGFCIGHAIGIAMAWSNCGYWSLIGIVAGVAVGNAVLSFSLSGWVPGWPQRKSGAGEMLKFGASVTGFGMVNYFARNADNFLIGAWWGPSALGVYSRAYGLLLMPSILVNRPLTSVMSPVLCRLQADPDRFRRTFKQLLSAIAYLAMPGVAALLVVSDAVVLVFLGDQWEGAIPVFSALGLAALFQGVYAVSTVALTATGQGKALFRLSFIVMIPTLLGFLIALPYGTVAVALAYSLTHTFIVCPLVFIYVAQFSPVKVRDFYLAVVWPLVLSIATAGSLWGLRSLFQIEQHVLLLALAGVIAAPSVVIAAYQCRNLAASKGK